MFAKRIKAFTLVELLVVIAIITSLLAFSAPFLQSFLVNTELDSTVDLSVSAIYLARGNAQGVVGDAPWGVRLQAGKITVFKGDSYASRDATYDLIYTTSPEVAISGTNEIIFKRVSGEPMTTGSISFVSSNGQARNIQINAKGRISY